MKYTNLGCLVHAPWELTDDPPKYGLDLFLNGKLILSKAYIYNPLDSDLVFDLNKDGTIRYWLKSENPEFNRLTAKNMNVDISYRIFSSVKKYYTEGYWKLDFKDSTLSIHFDQENIPDMVLKFDEIGANYGIFSKTQLIDSTINGQKCTFREIKSYRYIHPFFKF